MHTPVSAAEHAMMTVVMLVVRQPKKRLLFVAGYSFFKLSTRFIILHLLLHGHFCRQSISRNQLVVLWQLKPGQQEGRCCGGGERDEGEHQGRKYDIDNEIPIEKLLSS
ncbi:hypothetical protein L6452_09547 [Arctium lappa]|uniref:Uncharacterized protein n=1 Tax=Arctium lappa TaxID=4217 RepID=A0ACB9DLD1_ARCLA|nr:hypothetical protein L6452_09547 [Arctium lappa]